MHQVIEMEGGVEDLEPVSRMATASLPQLPAHFPSRCRGREQDVTSGL